MLDSLNRFFAAWLFTLRGLFNGWVLLSFAVLSLLQGGLLWFLVKAPATALGGWPIEFLRYWFNLEAIGHYPAHLIVLPMMFFKSSIVIYGIFGVAAFGIATCSFAHRFSGEWNYRGGYFAATFSKYIPLFIVWLIPTIIVILGITQFTDLFSSWSFGSPRRQLAVDLASRVLVLLFMSLWAYTTVMLVFDRLSLLEAVGGSIRRFFRRPIATFFLLAVPYSITVPFSLITTQANQIAQRFRPETIIIVLIAVIISQFLANCITCGTVTHYYLSEPAQ